jgi:hypothetical protein
MIVTVCITLIKTCKHLFYFEHPKPLKYFMKYFFGDFKGQHQLQEEVQFALNLKFKKYLKFTSAKGQLINPNSHHPIESKCCIYK